VAEKLHPHCPDADAVDAGCAELRDRVAGFEYTAEPIDLRGQEHPVLRHTADTCHVRFEIAGQVQVLDIQFRPLAGHAGDACVTLARLDNPIRLKMVWEGDKQDDALFCGACIAETERERVR